MKLTEFDTQERVLIVAEIGNNHEGDFSVAEKLVRTAAECGVDAVKFQTFKTEQYVSRSDKQRFDRLKSFELTSDQFSRLSELAHSLGLKFISTPLDLESVGFLEKIVDCLKVASGDITFYPLIRKIAVTKRPIILSTGVSDLMQIRKTIHYVEQCWKQIGFSGTLAVLHCVSCYPLNPDDANLRSIPFLARDLNQEIGYSDHTLGIEACCAAVALGATIIEKHFTLDKQFSDFRDHQISADPADMIELVRRARLVSRMLGRSEKRVMPCAELLQTVVGRSVAFNRSLSRGHAISSADLIWVRPAGGIPPGEEEKFFGRKLKRTVAPGELLTATDFE
jgi:N,N'-diacetyllegionaminate synthase